MSISDLAAGSTGVSPVRLALCITELEVGGAERCLVELATRLDRRQFDPVVYSLGPRPQGEQAALADRLDAAGIATHYLDARARWAAPVVLARLAARLRAQRPDIVQTFLVHANVLGTWAARLAGVRTIVTGIRVAERRSRLQLAGGRLIDRWATRQVCVSQSVADFSATVGGLDRSKLVVIPNGVDLRRFDGSRHTPCAVAGALRELRGGDSSHVGDGTRSVPATLAGRRLIGFIGRLDVQKGVDTLVELAPQILARLPEHDLVLVGRGPLQAQLAERIRQLQLRRIHLLGWRPDVPEILAAVELVVLPSCWEGLPNVLLEAMAAGKPVVARDVEGVREALGCAGAEQIVGGDSQVLSEKVVAISSCPQTQARLGALNRARVAQEFTLEAMVGRYAALYQRLLCRPIGPPR